MWCSRTYKDTDPRVGEPLCGECYDYAGHVLFSWHLPELWRRCTIALRRRLAIDLRSSGGDPGSVRVSFVEVVEMQARAIPHIHALIRLDPTNVAGEPANADDGEGWVSPLGGSDRAVLVRQTARTVTLTVEHHGGQDGETVSRVIGFGSQLDTQPLIAKSAGAGMYPPRRVCRGVGWRDPWPTTSPSRCTTSGSVRVGCRPKRPRVGGHSRCAGDPNHHRRWPTTA